MGDDDGCPLTVLLTQKDWNVFFYCLQELVQKGETLNPKDKEKRLQVDDGTWQSKNETGDGATAGTYNYADWSSNIPVVVGPELGE